MKSVIINFRNRLLSSKGFYIKEIHYLFSDQRRSARPSSFSSTPSPVTPWSTQPIIPVFTLFPTYFSAPWRESRQWWMLTSVRFFNKFYWRYRTKHYRGRSLGRKGSLMKVYCYRFHKGNCSSNFLKLILTSM